MNTQDYYVPDYTFFRQMDYYWLFDSELKFSRRANFDIYKDLDIKEYLKMRDLNRVYLSRFLISFNS